MIDRFKLQGKKKDNRKVIPEYGTKCEHVVIWWRIGMWQTFWGLTAATGGVPGGVCVPTSGLKVSFAICMHSSRVFRKVVHVDFTMFPVSIPAWELYTKSCISNNNFRFCLFTKKREHLTNFFQTYKPVNKFIHKSDIRGHRFHPVQTICVKDE